MPVAVGMLALRCVIGSVDDLRVISTAPQEVANVFFLSHAQVVASGVSSALCSLPRLQQDLNVSMCLITAGLLNE